MTDLQAVYFSFIHDADDGRRKDAEKALSESVDPHVRQIYEAGKEIGKVVRGEADAAALDSAVEKLKALPLLDYWKEFIEVSGQVVIGKALTVAGREKRSALLKQGLRMLSIAAHGAYPLSDYSAGLIRKAKEAEPALSGSADAILMNVSGLEPWDPKKRPQAVRPAAGWKKSVA